MGDITTRTGINAQYIDTKQRAQPVVKTTLEEAIKFAEQDQGEEAIIQISENEFAVVDLKDKTGNEALFDPAAGGAQFSTAMVVRNNNRVEVVSPLGQTSNDVKLRSTLRLCDVILGNSITGLRNSGDQQAGTGKAYQANLVHVLGQLEALEGPLTGTRDKLKGELDALNAANPKDPAAIDAKAKELEKAQTQLDELNTAKLAMRTKLLIYAPDSNTKIPGTNLGVGALRNKPEAVEAGLRHRIQVLTDKLGTNLSPEARASIEKQIKTLNELIAKAKTETVGNLQAQVHTDMRVGALGTINKAIVDQQAKVNANAAKVADLETELRGNPPNYAEVKGKLDKAKAELESSRSSLVTTIRDQAAVFREHSPKHPKSAAEACEAAAKVLDAQAAKLEAVKGKPAAEIQAAVESVRKEFQEGELVAKVEAAAKDWVGLSPKEGSLIKDIVKNTNGYITAYTSAKGAQERLDKLVLEAEAASKFNYKPPVKDMMADANKYIDAQNWKPGDAGISGVEANFHFNETYHALDKQMYELLGTPSWLTFGKFASREAGLQINNLETALSLLHTLTTFDGAAGNDVDAIVGLTRMIAADPKGLAVQGLLLAAQQAGIQIEKGASPENIAKAIVAGMDVVGTATKVLAAVEKLHTNLVKGNTEIFRNAAPLFDTFMKNPPDKRMAEVEKMMKAHPLYGKDPQAFRMGLQAFQKYDQIARLNAELKMPSTSATRKTEIEAKMKSLAEEANLLFVTVEQMFAQSIYNSMLGETGVMTGQMVMHDTTGVHPLLDGKGPGQANWAEFADRMGFDKVPPNTPGAMELDVLQTDGTMKKEWYKPNHAPGTISQYFRDGLDPATAKTMATGMLRNPPAYYNAEQQGTEMRQLIEKYDTSTPAGKADMNKALADYYNKHMKGSNSADNSVVALLDELQRQGKLGELDDNVRTLFFKELDDGWTTDYEYNWMGKLADASGTGGKAAMKAYLDDQWWLVEGQDDVYSKL
ncbi:MAG: hypothetical protein ACAI44_13180 [Candidatus Sericytochromatia bacterium]